MASNLEQARDIHGCGVEVEESGFDESAARWHDAALQAEKGWACKVVSQLLPNTYHYVEP